VTKELHNLELGQFETIPAMSFNVRLPPLVSDIIKEVSAGRTPPFRPELPKDACTQPLREMLEMCWTEDELQRPDFATVRRMYRKMHRWDHGYSLASNMQYREASVNRLGNV